MTSALINVVLIGHNDTDISTNLVLEAPPHEAEGFSVLSLETDIHIERVLAAEHVHVICSFGDLEDYKELFDLSLEYRRRWLHFEDKNKNAGELAQSVINCFVNVVGNAPSDTPLVSVFTPTYNTGKDINKVYQSLLNQSYDNWEWVIYDDSTEGATIEYAFDISKNDPRVKVFLSMKPLGIIGEVKRRCAGLTKGEILVELDHDDELTDNCLMDLVSAFKEFPDAGFAYTDCAEVFDDGENATYGETYAFGFGSYRYEDYRGKNYAVSNYPSVNAKTVRHIVGMPNHVRAWRRRDYFEIGGHNPDLHVADDYELCIRTFLMTRMIHINKLGYIQTLNRSGSNTQRVRNKEIQRLVRLLSNAYEEAIHERFVELGVDDFIWTEDGLDWDRNPEDNFRANYEWPVL